MDRTFREDASWCYRNCPGCGANASKPLFYKENVTFVECYMCKTVFVNPVPPDDVFSELYNMDWADYFQDEAKIERDFEPNRYWRELDAIPPQWRRGELLDVGCATGSFLVAARALPFGRVKGIDIAEPSVQYANERLGEQVAVAGSFLEQPFEEETFDVVTSWATLEHLPNPEAYVREAWRVLRPGGLFAFSVPNRNSIAMRGLGAKYHMVGLEHVNYFTRMGLSRLVERNQFEVVYAKTRGFNPFAFARDRTGRHLEAGWDAEKLLEEGASNAQRRKNRVVAIGERIVDKLVKYSRMGELLILSVQKI